MRTSERSSKTSMAISLFWLAGSAKGKMPKRKFRLNRIRVRRSYSTAEICDLFNCHVQTVRNWHRRGMKSIDPNNRPLLFIGTEIKRFLSERQNSRKIKLKEDEFYCPRCRNARQSIPEEIGIFETGRQMGKHDEQVLIKGECKECNCSLTRFGTKNGVKGTFFERIITQGSGRL